MLSSIVFLLLSICFAFGQDQAELLLSRREALEARLFLIKNEKKEIRYNTFIFDPDDTGKEVIAALADAAERGVKVQLILDGLTDGLVKNPHLLQALANKGVQIKIFNPVYRHALQVNLRNHIKSLIGTDEMIVGGRNTQGHYFHEYIDVETQIKGSQLDVAKKHFDSVWESVRVKTPIGSTKKPLIAEAKAELDSWIKGFREKTSRAQKFKRNFEVVEGMSYHADPPDIQTKRADGINKKIIDLIDRADKYLEFMNPYVYISPEEKAALKRAMDRGVKITIKTNASTVTDSKITAFAWDVIKNDLVEMGIEVRESKQYIHGKSIVRDMKEVFIGSFNLDMRSFNLNLENGVFIKSEKLAMRMTNHHRRIAKVFTKKLEKKIHDKSAPVLHKAGACLRDNMRRLITHIVYPHL